MLSPEDYAFAKHDDDVRQSVAAAFGVDPSKVNGAE